jgi:hypothetical protein
VSIIDMIATSVGLFVNVLDLRYLSVTRFLSRFAQHLSIRVLTW